MASAASSGSSKASTTHWGQLVCGPPGSGKTTYCAAMHEFLNKAGRPTVIVNLDPANERTPYPCAVNLLELIRVEDVAELYGLGPNGGLMYCLEFLEANIDWLEEKLLALQGHYFIFDCPGQAELYTHHTSFARIVQHLQKKLDFRLASVHLVDAHYCSDATKYISAALLSLTAMIRLELPHVNVLSKLDLVQAYGQPAFGLDFYTEAHDLRRLVSTIGDSSALGEARKRMLKPPASAFGKSKGDDDDDDNDGHYDVGENDDEEEDAALAASLDKLSSSSSSASSLSAEWIKRATDARRRIFLSKHRKLNARLAEVVEDYSMLGFIPISVREPESLLRLVKVVDKSHGFVPIHSNAKKQGPILPLSAGLAENSDGSAPAWMPKGPYGGGKNSGPASGTTTALAADGSASTSGDAIADTPLTEWDFERLGGFEERYMSRFGAEIYPEEEEEAAEGQSSRKQQPLKSRKVKEATAAQGAAAAAGDAGAKEYSGSASAFAAGARSGPKPGEKRPHLVGGDIDIDAAIDHGNDGYGADAEAMDDLPGLEPALIP